MNDHSGESILYAVLAGDRKVKQGAVGSGLHEADQDLHTPSKLAEIGAEQGAYALLGPVGFGVDALWAYSRRLRAGIEPWPDALPGLLGRSDFIVLAAPLTPETEDVWLDAIAGKTSTSCAKKSTRPACRRRRFAK